MYWKFSKKVVFKIYFFQRGEGDFVDLSQRGEKSHFSDPQSIATCKDPVTILLLGTADSGKSTVVKQMKVPTYI